MHLRCGNTKDGDQIVRCKNCGYEMCEACARDKGIFFHDYHCPMCDTPWRGGGVTLIGVITNDNEQ